MISGPAARLSFVVPVDARAEVVLLRADTEIAGWPLVCRTPLDLSVVDELARLQLGARRQGCSIRLRDACPELAAVLRFVGLSDVLEAGRKAEQGEQRGVEEVVVTDDPVA